MHNPINYFDLAICVISRARANVRPDFRQPLGKRVAITVNTILAKDNIKEYEYILKVDADASTHTTNV